MTTSKPFLAPLALQVCGALSKEFDINSKKVEDMPEVVFRAIAAEGSFEKGAESILQLMHSMVAHCNTHDGVAYNSKRQQLLMEANLASSKQMGNVLRKFSIGSITGSCSTAIDVIPQQNTGGRVHRP